MTSAVGGAFLVHDLGMSLGHAPVHHDREANFAPNFLTGCSRFHGSPPYENERTRPVLTGTALSLPASFPRIYNDSIYNFEASEDLWRTFGAKCS
jgi:hypothetical protein